MLKKTPRTGYQFLGTGGESVADHSFRTAVIGFALAAMSPACNRNRVVLMCLFHDLPEARTGDHNYVNKKYVRIEEDRAIADQLGGLSFGEEVQGLLKEYNDCSTLESMLAKDADQIDLILELKAQLDCGNPNARDWLSFALERLSTKAGREMAASILETHSADWWFTKDTDWWVNGRMGPSHKD